MSGTAKIRPILAKISGIYGSVVPIPTQTLEICQCGYSPQIEHGVPRDHKDDILILGRITTTTIVTTEKNIR